MCLRHFETKAYKGNARKRMETKLMNIKILKFFYKILKRVDLPGTIACTIKKRQ